MLESIPNAKAVVSLKAHVFVCTHERPQGSVRGCCKEKESEALIDLFKKELARVGIHREVRAQKSGCLDICEYGPSVVIYPEGIWYGKVQPVDVREIVENHLRDGNPVERLRVPGK